MKTGIELIAIERKEQIEKHGYGKEHDALHDDGSLLDAAICCAADTRVYYREVYAAGVAFNVVQVSGWDLPVTYDGNVLWDNCESTHEERIHQLKVAGALIAAEIDRLNQ